MSETECRNFNEHGRGGYTIRAQGQLHPPKQVIKPFCLLESERKYDWIVYLLLAILTIAKEENLI